MSGKPLDALESKDEFWVAQASFNAKPLQMAQASGKYLLFHVGSDMRHMMDSETESSSFDQDGTM
jgi:hydrogenase maturation factor